MTDYYTNPRVSNSDIGELLKSYESYQHARANKKSSEAMDLGSAFHCLILEPEKFNERFTYEKPDLRTNAGKARKIEIEEKGLITLSPEQKTVLEGMETALKSNPLAMELINGKGAVYEKEIYFSYEGIDCKSKLDCVTDKHIIDLKTVAGFTKELINPKNKYYEFMPAGPWDIQDVLKFLTYERGYFRQGRFYQIAELSDTDIYKDFILIIVSSSAPYQIFIIKPDATFDALADEQIKSGIATYKAGIKFNSINSIIEISNPN